MEATQSVEPAPETLVFRARGLTKIGARPHEVLPTVDRGLGLASGSGAIWSELMHARIELLSQLGRNDELRAAGQDYLASGATARRDEVLQILGYERDSAGLRGRLNEK